MKFRCVWSIVLILGLAAAGTQAEAAGDRAVIAHSAYDLEEKGNVNCRMKLNTKTK